MLYIVSTWKLCLDTALEGRINTRSAGKGRDRDKEIEMKNKIKLIGIIAFVVVIGLLLAGCGDKTGTLEIKNSLSSSIEAYAVTGSSAPSSPTYKTIEPNKSQTWELDAGDAYYGWRAIGGGTQAGAAKVTIKKGETNTITAAQ